jgi:hypothetical protein
MRRSLRRLRELGTVKRACSAYGALRIFFEHGEPVPAEYRLHSEGKAV